MEFIHSQAPLYYFLFFLLPPISHQTHPKKTKPTYPLCLALCFFILYFMAGLWVPNPNPNLTLSRTNSSSSTSSFGGYFMDQQSNNNHSSYNYMMMEKMEKRQLFLRSYQFCRKKSLAEKIKGSLVKVKRVICLRLRSAKRLRKSVCFRLRYGFSFRRRRLCRLLNYYRHNRKCDNSYCFW